MPTGQLRRVGSVLTASNHTTWSHLRSCATFHTGGSSNPWASMPYRLDTTVTLNFFVTGRAFGPPSCQCEVCERHYWNLTQYFASLNRCPNVVGWQPCGRKRVWPPKILLRMIAMAAAWKVYLHGKLLLQMSFHSRSLNGGRPFQGDEVGYSATKARRRKRVLLFSIPNYCRDNAITMCSCLKHLLYLRRSLLPMLSNVVRTCFFNVFFTCFVPDTHVWTRWILSKNHICWEVKKNIQLPRGSKPLCRKREAEEGSEPVRTQSPCIFVVFPAFSLVSAEYTKNAENSGETFNFHTLQALLPSCCFFSSVLRCDAWTRA